MAWIKAGRYKLALPEVDGTLARGNADIIDMLKSRLWGTDKHTIRRLSETLQQIEIWDKDMSRKTYRIELKIDFEDDKRHEALIQVAQQYARDFLASAALLQDGRKPACVLMADDAFYGVEEIDLMDASSLLHESNQTSLVDQTTQQETDKDA